MQNEPFWKGTSEEPSLPVDHYSEVVNSVTLANRKTKEFDINFPDLIGKMALRSFFQKKKQKKKNKKNQTLSASRPS